MSHVARQGYKDNDKRSYKETITLLVKNISKCYCAIYKKVININCRVAVTVYRCKLLSNCKAYFKQVLALTFINATDITYFVTYNIL